MNARDVNRLTESLQGISYQDWQKVRIGIDEYFRKKTSEFQSELRLTDISSLPECVKHTTHLQSE